MQMAVPVALLLMMMLALGALLMVAPQPVQTPEPLDTSAVVETEESLFADQ